MIFNRKLKQRVEHLERWCRQLESALNYEKEQRYRMMRDFDALCSCIGVEALPMPASPARTEFVRVEPGTFTVPDYKNLPPRRKK